MTKRTIWLVVLLFITNLCSFSANKLDWSNTKYKNVDEWIDFGKKHLRRTYRNGGVGPYAFDCSGFTMYMYKELGYSLPHSSSAQADYGDKIKATQVQPGDLVFYTGSKGSSIGHVGIVIEVTDDDFSFIHASLKQGICIDKSTHSYYKSRYKTARRIYDMTSEKSKKRHEEETIPTPQPQEEELELPGQTTDVDNPSDNNTVDNKQKQSAKKKESRRERRKREKAEKQRLEKEKDLKKKQEEAKKKNKQNSQNNSSKNETVKKDSSKKEVDKEPSKKTTPKQEEKNVVAKKTHVVEKGETMYRISKMAGLTVDELMEINGLKTNDLSIGQILIIEK